MDSAHYYLQLDIAGEERFETHASEETAQEAFERYVANGECFSVALVRHDGTGNRQIRYWADERG